MTGRKKIRSSGLTRILLYLKKVFTLIGAFDHPRNPGKTAEFRRHTVIIILLVFILVFLIVFFLMRVIIYGIRLGGS